MADTTNQAVRVEIDLSTIEEATRVAIVDSVRGSLQGYTVRDQLTKATNEAVAGSNLAVMVGGALKQVLEQEAASQCRAIAERMRPVLADVLTSVLIHSLAGMISAARVSATDRYMSSEDRAKLQAQVADDLRGKMAPPLDPVAAPVPAPAEEAAQ